MQADSTSWGLTQKERRIVLGIRAAGLFLFAAGLPVIETVGAYIVQYTVSPNSDAASARTFSIFDLLQDRTFWVNLVSSSGRYLLAIVAGIYLMRADPRPLLRSIGAKV
jgi:hypothetical protein